MPDAVRASNWMAAASGQARIVLGTRLAVLAQIPRLAAIVVDEEHDPSFKQQEGIRYSARDMAIARASLARLPILLGSATPSLESWSNARTGRYRLLQLTARAGGTALPTVRIAPLRGARLKHGLTDAAVEAIRDTIGRGEQALVFLNRRGYAPVISCDACGWLSRCDHCDAYRVLHRLGSAADARPRAVALPARLPPLRGRSGRPRAPARNAATRTWRRSGRGTQRLEEGLAGSSPTPASRRLDRDVASRRGATERFLAAAHAGEVDLLIGTQMLAKGHDFTPPDAGGRGRCGRRPVRGRLPGAGAAVRDPDAGRRPRRPPQRRRRHDPDPDPLSGASAVRVAQGARLSRLRRRRSCRRARRAACRRMPTRRCCSRRPGRWKRRSASCKAHVSAYCRSNPPPISMSATRCRCRWRKLRDVSRAQLLVECSSRKLLHRLLVGLAASELDPLAGTIRGTIRWQLVIDPIEI